MDLHSNISFLFVVPTFNAGVNLKEFSKLFIDQTYKKWRVLFVDGGSCDKDIIYLNELIKSDIRFNLIKQRDSSPGIFGAMNQGFEIAKSNEYIFFWGSDDFIFKRDTLANISNIISKYSNKNEKNHFYIFKARYINTKKNLPKRFSTFPKKINSKLISNYYFSILLFLGFTPPHQSTLFTPLAKNVLNYYSCNYKLSADLNYFLTISSLTKVAYEYNNLQIVNMSDGGVSGKYLGQRISNVLKIYLKFYGLLFFIPFTFRYFLRIFSKLKLQNF